MVTSRVRPVTLSIEVPSLPVPSYESILTVEQVASPQVVPEPPSYSNQRLCDDIVSPTPKRRRKGPCMSRRRGQTGYVWQKNQSGNKEWDSTAAAYGQVWVDIPGKETRQRKFYRLGICRSKSEARRRLKEMIERDGINSTVDIAQSIDSTTFGQQADWWIKAIEDGRVLHRRK